MLGMKLVIYGLGCVMPKKAKELSALEVKRIKKTGLHAVGGVAGLLLQVTASGARSWILRVMVGSKRRDIGLGGFPDVPLKLARDKAREAREQINNGFDPVAIRKAARYALIVAQAKDLRFDQAAKQCHAAKVVGVRSAKHTQDWINSLERYAFPKIGSILVADINLSHVKSVLEPIWTTRTETATRIRQRIETVLTWAKVSGHRKGDNPAQWAGNLEEVFASPKDIKKVKHHAAVPWEDVSSFMKDLRKREGISARALEFLILTAARSGEVRLATWDEFDLEGKVWTIPEERMKAKKVHKVPISADVLKLLKVIPILENSPYVFTAPRGGALSDMSISAVMRRMKVGAVPHGFRSSFKDWARSRTAYADEVSELALAHVNSDATRAAYARDELLPKRALLMRDWAKFCNKPKMKGDVVSIGKART